MLPALSTFTTSGLEDVHFIFVRSAVVLIGFALGRRCSFAPSSRLYLSAISIASKGMETVTLQVSVNLPTVAEIVASPAPTAVTLPFLSTVATFVLEDFQVTVLSSVVYTGFTFTFRSTVSPFFRSADALSSWMLSSGAKTRTSHLAVLPWIFAVMVELPMPTAVTTPSLDTLTIFSSDDSQVRPVVVSESTGSKVSFSFCGSLLSVRVSSVLSSVIDLTDTLDTWSV